MPGQIICNAGKCTRQGTTKRVVPDPRKGTLSLEQRDDLLHFCWRERGQAETEEAEEDLIIFPEDATLERVPVDKMTLVREDGEEVGEADREKNTRIYALRFKSSDQVSFYWMQSGDGSKDDDVVARVNAIIGEEQEEEEEEGDRMEQ
ncbi:proteasome complex subunit Rpn13 ubiquitin receptor-domain-containing protein [Protomyces lactucae-debilis]|uniref:Proteasome complex subunit Rpn13 ubiquitin receptor-domain-containing protein n=1 Tax=Protomyces lactucae-debilis TaxID=2754530 RepID=A0A1Y2F4G2_PROLT|nr:proteasome complex subunit Rpn13 ubiquitin receptor-domain-containing protein [Protomyces lactucae-debilis]ORY78216.1 proteasome complex subunit Rpn13 ubiquitin receptor-domain-containing protein [Protomyces lactucae-debilis]